MTEIPVEKPYTVIDQQHSQYTVDLQLDGIDLRALLVFKWQIIVCQIITVAQTYPST